MYDGLTNRSLKNRQKTQQLPYTGQKNQPSHQLITATVLRGEFQMPFGLLWPFHALGFFWSAVGMAEALVFSRYSLLHLNVISSFFKIDFEIKTNAKKSRRFDLSEVIFK